MNTTFLAGLPEYQKALTGHDELSELRAENARLELAWSAAVARIEQMAASDRELYDYLEKVKRATLWQHVVLWWRSP
ncbi:MAG: hypothetical protein RL260_2795 [Pseudomonadota bacterium]